MTRWTLKALTAAFVALLAEQGASSRELAAGPSLSLYARPQIMVRVGRHRRIHIRCMGVGSPTVILSAGQGDWGLSWHAVQPLVAQASRVCAWDRAGLGFSDPSPEPQDVEHTTRDLERALRGAALGGPYVLVGHSAGSFETLLFAYRHKRRVAGIVLVDPSVPSQLRRFRAVSPESASYLASLDEEQLALLHECISEAHGNRFEPGSEAWSDCVREPPAEYPADLRSATLSMDSRVGGAKNLASFIANWDRSSAQVARARRDLGALPLIVLTTGKPFPLPPEFAGSAKRLSTAWTEMHIDLARLSTAGRHRVVANAGHYIQLDDPGAVVAAVSDIIAAARREVVQPAPRSVRAPSATK